MALEPYRRRIGLPDAPGPSGMVDTRVADIGASISTMSETLLKAADPIIKRNLQKRVEEDASRVTFERDEAGNLILEKAEEGGAIYRAAFDEMVQQRYLNELNVEFQDFLNTDRNARIQGLKPFDPDDFEAAVKGRYRGIVDTLDPSIKGKASELLAREMLERTRTFRDEHGRTVRSQTISGFQAQTKVFMDRIARASDLGLTQGEVNNLKAAVSANLDHLERMGMLGPAETAAAMMEADQEVDNFERYVSSQRDLLSVLPLISSMSGEDLTRLEYGMRLPYGAEGEVLESMGDVSGVTSVPGGGSGTWSLPFDGASLSPSQGQRFGAGRGGRSHNGLDIPAPAGTPVKPVRSGEVIDTGFDARSGNFVVVRHADGSTSSYSHLADIKVKAGQRVDAASTLGGVGRTGNATGNTLHLVIKPDGKNPVDPLRVLGKPHGEDDTKAVEAAIASSGLTFERIRGWDSSTRSQALTMITDRRQVLTQQAIAEKQEQAQAARHREQMDELRTLGQTIDGANSGGFGGNWTAKEKGVLNERFRSAVDPSRLHEMDMRVTASRWIAQNNYVPREIVNYLDSGIRHPTAWRPALELYQNLQQTTMGNGARVGDLLVMELDPRTRALLEQGRILKQSMSDEEVGARLETLRSGSGFTKKEAQAAFAETTEERYDQVRNKQLRDAYGIPSNQAIAPELIDRFDESYAANLDLVDRNPTKAMQRAIEQNAGLMTRRGIFADGVGPSVLIRTYSNEKLRDFFTGAINPTTGQPLIPKNQGHLIGGNQSTVKLKPLGNALSTIGRYEVRVFNPKNPSELIDRFEVDLGSELNGFFGANDRQVTARPTGDPVGDARIEREAQGRPAFQRAVREANPFTGRRD